MAEAVILTLAEGARRCGVRPSLLRHWLKHGVIPGTLLGQRRVQLTLDELTALRKRKW